MKSEKKSSTEQNNDRCQFYVAEEVVLRLQATKEFFVVIVLTVFLFEANKSSVADRNLDVSDSKFNET